MINLFNEAYYLAYNQDVAAAVARGEMTAEQHFNLFGKAEGRAPGPMFDSEYYLESNPDVRVAVEAGLTAAYEHFLMFGAGENRSPLIVFDADYYLARNQDVAASVGDGFNAVQHFLLYGNAEARPISPFIDLAAYLSANPDIADAVKAGHTSALLHLLDHGVFEGRDLGNGIALSLFQNDAEFVNALEIGNLDLALARMQDVAPFLPGFKPPKGWTPAADTPIPIDFVPPEGMKLVVPPSVKVPPELLPLPDTFEPIDNGGGDNPRTFRLDIDGDTYTFGGTARGEIKVEIVDDIASFNRQGITAKQTIDLDDWIPGTTTIALKSRDTLVLALADVEKFADAGMSDCGCIQHEVFTGTGLVRLNTTTIGDYANLTLFSPALSLDFNGSKAVTVESSLQLHARHADGLLIRNEGMVGVLPEETSDGITLGVSSSLDDHAVTIIGATEGDDIIGIQGSRLTIIDSGNGDDVITIDGSDDPDDCGCPAVSLNIVAAGEGNDHVILEGAALSILHAGAGGDTIRLSNEGLTFMMVAAGSHDDEDQLIASDSFWSKDGDTWDVINGFEFREGTDDAINGVFILVGDTDPETLCDDTYIVNLHGDNISFGVENGIATANKSLNFDDMVLAISLLTKSETTPSGANAMVAFLHGDDTYFFLSDGVEGLHKSDTLIQLTDLTITDIDQLLVLSGGFEGWFAEFEDDLEQLDDSEYLGGWPESFDLWIDDIVSLPWPDLPPPG